MIRSQNDDEHSNEVAATRGDEHVDECCHMCVTVWTVTITRSLRNRRRQRHSASSSAGWRHIFLLLHSTNWTALHQFLFCTVNCKVFL